MESLSEIPDDWDTKAEVVMMHPHTGEVAENLSSTGAGPHEPTVVGRIMEKPCSNCEGRTVIAPAEGRLTCPECNYSESADLTDY